jgi:hypothetical protein
VAVAGVILVGVAAGQLRKKVGENIGRTIFDPTLAPDFYEEALRNRIDRLRDREIDPETEQGVKNSARLNCKERHYFDWESNISTRRFSLSRMVFRNRSA